MGLPPDRCLEALRPLLGLSLFLLLSNPCDGEITFVFAIFIVNNDHHLARAHGRNSILDTRKRPCGLEESFDYVKAPDHVGDVSEHMPA
jgi:hypothetical protein